MKKKIIGIMLAASLLLNGCSIHWSYRTMVLQIDNEYFKSEVILTDAESTIIRNKVTGEYFLLINGAYGVSICPIKVEEAEDGFLVCD